MSNTYTDEDFKKILKNLFTEKKRVKELERQLEEKGLQKRFRAKLSDIHKLSMTEEYAKLKEAYHRKELECDHCKNQLERVRPALKKLLTELKSARREIATQSNLKNILGTPRDTSTTENRENYPGN